MNYTSSKILGILAVIVLVLSPLAILPAFAANYPTTATLSIAPNPGGVGQMLTVTMTVSPDPPPGARFTDSFYLGIRAPDLTWQTLVFSSALGSGSTYFTYIPSQTGTYVFNFNYTGNTIGSDTYYASAAGPQAVAVYPTVMTSAYCDVSPNPLGVGESALVYGWITPAPPSGSVYHNCYFRITAPDGSWDQYGPLSTDDTGGVYQMFTPTQEGSYGVDFWMTDEVIGSNLYLGSSFHLGTLISLSVSVSPSSWTMDVGQTATFIALSAGGSGSYVGYQWYVGGVEQVGETASTFDYYAGSVGLPQIRVTVTDSLGATSPQSAAPFVVVNTALGPIDVAPTGPLTMDEGQSTTLSASGTTGGSGTLTYQWYLDDSPVWVGASYSYTAAVSGSPHSVYCVVTDSASSPASVTSNTVFVTVNAALGVSISPAADFTMDVAQSRLFTSAVTGGTPLYAYQWYLDGSQVPGATNPTWTYVPTSVGYHYVYLVVRDAAYALEGTDPVTVFVNPASSVSISPSSAILNVGDSIMFMATASGGTPPYTYQWYMNGNPVPGETNPTYTYTATSMGSHGVYVLVNDNVDQGVFSNAASITVTPYALTVTSIVDESPSSDWTYLLMQGETEVDEFYLLAAGETKKIPLLYPGSYQLMQTDKLRYNVQGVTVDSVSVTPTKLDNFTYVDINMLTGSTVSVVFSNEWIPDTAFARPGGSGGSYQGYTMPCRVAVPVQVSWNPDIDSNQVLDLVKGRATKIMVNLADLLTTSNPTKKVIAPTDSITVTLTCNSASFWGSTSLPSQSKTGAAITSNSFMIFDINPPNLVGQYTITCTTKKGGTTVSSLSTNVKVRETSPLYLYYNTLARDEYGTEDANAYGTMVTETAGFVKAVYPVPEVTVFQNTAGIAGAMVEGGTDYVGLLKDCQAVEVEAKSHFFNSPNVIGVAIAPDLSADGIHQNYFAYHGAVNSAGQAAVGVSFGPAVKGVVVSDGYYTTAAHEIAHTFGLYFGVPEQYEQYTPGAPANGFRVEQNQWRTGCYDFMGLSTLRSTTSTWTSTDLAFEPLFSKLKTAADPQLILVNGIIWKDGTIETVELPDQWYTFPYGIPDTVPTGDYAIRFTLLDGTTVEVSFAAQFFVNLDPGLAIGEDMPKDFSGFGSISVNFAGFAFAAEYPANTDPTQPIEIVDNSVSGGGQVIGEIAPEDVISQMTGALSAGFGGFISPVKNGATYRWGTTVAVKFQLKTPEGAFITTAQPRLFLYSDNTKKEIAAASVPASSVGNVFRYDFAKNQYIFNLDTSKIEKGWWELRVYLGDGADPIKVTIQLK